MAEEQAQAPAGTGGAMPPVEQPKKKRFKLWHKVVGGLVAGFVALIVLLVVIASLATSGASSASDEFVDYLLEGDSAGAYSMFSTEAKAQVPEDRFAEVVTQMAAVLDESADQTGKSVETSTESGTTGEVTYEINGSDGTYILTVNLVKEGDDWKVLNFDSSLK
ncbi:DUF4878 domain-containing protein [Nocardioides sp.]|uniref:DUF4878 domain-containing protein n=1 Tax=Nocardioides sp. TaxID=35761 RepID=UPI003561DA00